MKKTNAIALKTKSAYSVLWSSQTLSLPVRAPFSADVKAPPTALRWDSVAMGLVSVLTLFERCLHI